MYIIGFYSRAAKIPPSSVFIPIKTGTVDSCWKSSNGYLHKNDDSVHLFSTTGINVIEGKIDHSYKFFFFEEIMIIIISKKLLLFKSLIKMLFF